MNEPRIGDPFEVENHEWIEADANGARVVSFDERTVCIGVNACGSCGDLIWELRWCSREVFNALVTPSSQSLPV